MPHELQYTQQKLSYSTRAAVGDDEVITVPLKAECHEDAVQEGKGIFQKLAETAYANTFDINGKYYGGYHLCQPKVVEVGKVTEL